METLGDKMDRIAELDRKQQEYLKQKRSSRAKTKQPTLATLQEWFNEEGGCEATDGCWVEPDGYCPHGCPSWMLVLGLI